MFFFRIINLMENKRIKLSVKHKDLLYLLQLKIEKEHILNELERVTKLNKKIMQAQAEMQLQMETASEQQHLIKLEKYLYQLLKVDDVVPQINQLYSDSLAYLNTCDNIPKNYQLKNKQAQNTINIIQTIAKAQDISILRECILISQLIKIISNV